MFHLLGEVLAHRLGDQRIEHSREESLGPHLQDDAQLGPAGVVGRQPRGDFACKLARVDCNTKELRLDGLDNRRFAVDPCSAGHDHKREALQSSVVIVGGIGDFLGSANACPSVALVKSGPRLCAINVEAYRM